jgi:hypothetical protein
MLRSAFFLYFPSCMPTNLLDREGSNNQGMMRITYSRESLLTIRHGLETCHGKLPASIKVCKNMVETEWLGSDLVPIYCHETKVSSPTATNLIPRPFYAAARPRYVWMFTSLCDHKCMFWKLFLAGIIKQCGRCKEGEHDQQGEDGDHVLEGVRPHSSSWLGDLS